MNSFVKITILLSKRVTNDFDYFKRLHECVLTKASKELNDAELLDLFEITGVDLTDEQLDDFGDKDYILYRIEQELNTQFNTRKQLLLKTIYAYIAHSGSLYDTDCLSLLSGDEEASITVLERGCTVLGTNIGDVMDYVPDNEANGRRKR